jgi:hypothetical protein
LRVRAAPGAFLVGRDFESVREQAAGTPAATAHQEIFVRHLPAENFLSQRFDSAKQIFFARDAGNLIAQLAVLKKEQSRDRANVVLERETLIFVHVNFRYLDRARFFARNLIEQRRDHFAGAAPFRPKIDNYGFVTLRNFAVKIGFIEIDNGVIIHGFRKGKSKSE